MKRLLLCCKVYVSESREAAVLQQIERAAQGTLVHAFPDQQYNRIGYTLAGGAELNDAVVRCVEAAIEGIDIRNHSGSHPRLGAVDNVCFHPLQACAMMDAAAAARSCASAVGNQLRVPAFLYGAAAENGRTLVELRRSLGYFKNHAQQQAPPPPDFGPHLASGRPSAGIVTIGAAPWISNYNVAIETGDLAVGRKISRAISASSGGLPAVQAMALRHGAECIEIACNLLNERITSTADVQSRVEAVAAAEGVRAHQGYRTSPSEQETLELANRGP